MPHQDVADFPIFDSCFLVNILKYFRVKKNNLQTEKKSCHPYSAC